VGGGEWGGLPPHYERNKPDKKSSAFFISFFPSITNRNAWVHSDQKGQNVLSNNGFSKNAFSKKAFFGAECASTKKQNTLLFENRGGLINKGAAESGASWNSFISSSAYSAAGTLVCGIYSGLFSTQTAKNILVIGNQETDKTAFIQAIAGETELKVITDNANRYTLVMNGLPVGIRLLKDVFDAIALHTPCIFLLEEIHVIGERRGALISDEEKSQYSESIFGSEKEEVHEKNQMLYTSSRHKISQAELLVEAPRWTSLKSRINFIAGFEKRYESNQQEPAYPNKKNVGINLQSLAPTHSLTSTSLQFHPYIIPWFKPETSASTASLNIKSIQKSGFGSTVEEIPWAGLPMEQFIQLPRLKYSVKVKVIYLVQKAVENLYVKVNMITDLLLIIDSVRSNRGFLVFATTHLPSVLDPALRRPGRFDETISLPSITYKNRWQIRGIGENKVLTRSPFAMPGSSELLELNVSRFQKHPFSTETATFLQKMNLLYSSAYCYSFKSNNRPINKQPSVNPLLFIASRARFHLSKAIYPNVNYLASLINRIQLKGANLQLPRRINVGRTLNLFLIFINLSAERSYKKLHNNSQLAHNSNGYAAALLTNKNSILVASAPCHAPVSLVTLPSRRFEIYRRWLRHPFYNEPQKTTEPKIEIHQKQKLIKNLYLGQSSLLYSLSSAPLLPNNTSVKIINQLAVKKGASVAEIMSAHLLSHQNNDCGSAFYPYYKEKILNRHRFYLTNQWWNGQLAEHNSETTFASDVDWRFVPANADNENLGSDLLIDFPDSEQYYNPRQRRWMLTKGYWSYWFGRI
jgi:hypothetical protein